MLAARRREAAATVPLKAVARGGGATGAASGAPLVERAAAAVGVGVGAAAAVGGGWVLLVGAS